MASNQPTDRVNPAPDLPPLRPDEVRATVWMRVNPDTLNVSLRCSVVQTLAEILAYELDEFDWCIEASVHVNAAAGSPPPIPSKDARDQGREGIAFFDDWGDGEDGLEENDDE